MKFQLENKHNIIFNKKITLTKKKGENIMIGGGDGSAKNEIIQQFIYSGLISNCFNNNIIHINLTGNNFDYHNIEKMLHSLNLFNKKNFFTFIGMSTYLDSFLDINFISQKKQINEYLKDKYTYFIMPEMGSIIGNNLFYTIQKQLYLFLNNLPTNNGKEIPIIIDNICNFSDNEFDLYIKLIKKLNKKGYFFVTGNYGMFNFHNFDRNFQLLKDNHEHFFVAHSQLNLDNKFSKNLKFYRPLNRMRPCEFYYLKGFVIKNKKPLSFKENNFSNTEKENETMPLYQKDLVKLLQINKIQNF